MIETSVQVPTRSLAVSATASSLGRKTPKISADAVKTDEMMRFRLSFWFGGFIASPWGLSAYQNASRISQFQPGVVNRVVGQSWSVLLVRRLPVVGIATLVASKGQNLNFAVSTNAIAEGLGFKYTNPPAGVSAPPPGISQGLDIPSLVEGSND